MVEKIIEELKEIEEIEAILLGGSRATGVFDEKSDYDFYIYVSKPLTEVKRREILEKYVSYMEFSNEFWELEDDGVLKNGVEIEFIYREIKWMEEVLDNLLFKGYVSNGYTTCFVDNLIKSKVLYDPKNKINRLKEKYVPMLNDEIYKKIITNNFPILLDKMPSIYYQIEKAMRREDKLSINHRTTAFFEMYFDILFAVNKTTHPGEKRLLETAKKLDKVPCYFDCKIEALFDVLYTDYEETLKLLESFVIDLHQILRNEGFELSYRSFK